MDDDDPDLEELLLAGHGSESFLFPDEAEIEFSTPVATGIATFQPGFAVTVVITRFRGQSVAVSYRAVFGPDVPLIPAIWETYSQGVTDA